MSMPVIARTQSRDGRFRSSAERRLLPCAHLDHHLRKGHLWSWKILAHETLTLRGHLGHGWVTMEGQGADEVLSPGTVLQYCGPGLLVLEALEGGVAFECESEG